MRSTNNGTTWDNATSPTAYGLYEVTFGNDTFFAVGGFMTPFDQGGVIVRSTDNGTNWDNVTNHPGIAYQAITSGY